MLGGHTEGEKWVGKTTVRTDKTVAGHWDSSGGPLGLLARRLAGRGRRCNVPLAAAAARRARHARGGGGSFEASLTSGSGPTRELAWPVLVEVRSGWS